MLFVDQLKNKPLLQLLLPFMAGIVLQVVAPLSLTFTCIFFIISVIALFLYFLSKKRGNTFARQWLFGVFTALVLFIAGTERVRFNRQYLLSTEHYFNLGFANTGKKNVIYIGNIISAPVEKEKSYKAEIKMIAAKNDSLFINPDIKLLAYFQKDSCSQELDFGDQVTFSSSISKISEPKNPYQFNYKRYMEFQGVCFQSYIPTEKWQLTDRNQGSWLYLSAHKTRKYLLNIYRNYEIKGDEFAVLAALSLGYKDQLDDQIRKTFSASGATHLIAVSGLHIGIIYALMNYLFFFMQRKRCLAISKILIIIILLWFYAFITGLSSSVVRAVIMFSLFGISKLFRRTYSSFNILAAAAFCMLLYNPFSITEVGFQLSFMAVAAILFFQPRFQKLVEPPNKALHYIWVLITVSVAAQLGTLPIVLLYFRIFPVYFCLTNIVAIPLVGIILYTAAFLFIFSGFPPVAKIIAIVLDNLVYILNQSLSIIEALPFSVIGNILIDTPDLIIFYLLIISITVLFVLKKPATWLVVLSLLIVWTTKSAIRDYRNSNINQLIVYHINKTTAISYISNSRNICYTYPALINQPKAIEYAAAYHWNRLGVPEPDYINLNSRTTSVNNIKNQPPFAMIKGNPAIQFGKKQILIIRNDFAEQYSSDSKIIFDYVILTNNADINIEELASIIDFQCIVIDASNSGWRKNNWIAECEKHNINCHSVNESGAFITDL